MTELRRLADWLAAADPLGPAAAEAIRTAEVFAAWAATGSDMADAVEALGLAHDLAELLRGSAAELNKRAALILTCRKGSACYRVFTIPGYRPLGVSAHGMPAGPPGSDGWMRVADWIQPDPAPEVTRRGRCRCCVQSAVIPERSIVDLLAAGRRRAPAPRAVA